MAYTLGIDLGGSSVKGVVVTREGMLLEECNRSFDPDREKDWSVQILEFVESAERRFGGKAEAIGLSAPGLASAEGDCIAIMPGRLKGLEGFQWTSFLRSAQAIPVLNDGHAALLGEIWLGAGAGFRNVFMMTLGTGVGGAAVVDGRLLKGHIGRAGHLGHVTLDLDGPSDVCNAPGSIEMLIGNCSIEQRTVGRFQTTHALIQAYESGDAFAAEVWLKSVRALACAVSSCINVLDPEAVILGGGIARCGEALFLPLQSVLDEIEWRPAGSRVKIVPAKLGELAGAYGAARQALRSNGLCAFDDEDA